MTAANKILIIVTNADVFEKVGFRTGLWLGELVDFWEVAEKAGFKMDIASPFGGKVPIDPESLLLTEVGDAVGLKGAMSRRYESKVFMSELDNTLSVSSLDASEYDAIYMTGGHGVMFDFPTSTQLAELVARFYESGKIVSAVCHGPCGLLQAKLSNGEFLINGKNLTGYSWKEEILAKRDNAVPFSLEDELQVRGAKYTKAMLPFGSHVVEDGLLITGQNPRSAEDVGKLVVKRLSGS